MMLLAFGFLLLGLLQSFAAPDFQVIALIEMKVMLNDSRDVLKDWRDYQVSPCYFPSVVCQDNKVTGITLSSSGLTGVLSPSIAKLTTLQQLLLDGNSITGGIPQELGNLSSLMILRLGRNRLNGSIPESFGRLSELQNLDLSQNLLSGNIPSSLSNLPSLKDINLAYNNLRGEIPEQLLQVYRYNYTGNHLNCGQHLISCEGGTTKTGGSRNPILKVVLGSIGGAVTLLVTVVLFLWWQRMRYRPEIYIDVPGHSLKFGQLKCFSWPELQIATNNFSEQSVLGKGGFGKVYKGVLVKKPKRLKILRLTQGKISKTSTKAEPGKIRLWGANTGTLHDIEGVPGRLKSATICSGEVINSLAFLCIDRNGLQHAAGNAGSDHTVRTARDVRLELLEKITGGFSEEHKIGSGGYGKVYKGVLNGKEIAVKRLHCYPALDDEMFKNECENLMRVRHQNIVELVGYCHEIRHRYVEIHDGRTVWAEMVDRVLCFEYLQNGSLDKHLYEEHRGLDWCTRYKIIKGICEGLNYLHGLEKSILHLDLKPANILLDENMVPKIADFGLSRLFSGTHITKYTAGTQMYMPPEYAKEGRITKKHDVFSLGVIIIQIMTGPKGYSKYWEMSPQQFIELVHQNWKVRVEATSMHTSAGEDCKHVKRCIEIALNCVKPERQKRPTIGDIIHKLREIETMTHEVPMPFSQESGSARSSHFKTEMVQNWSQVKDSSDQQREVLQKQSGKQQKARR